MLVYESVGLPNVITRAVGDPSAAVDPRVVPLAMGWRVGGVGGDHISVHFSIDPESPINLYVTEDLTQHLLNRFSSFSSVAGLPSDWLQVFGTEAVMASVKGKLDTIQQNGLVSTRNLQNSPSSKG